VNRKIKRGNSISHAPVYRAGIFGEDNIDHIRKQKCRILWNTNIGKRLWRSSFQTNEYKEVSFLDDYGYPENLPGKKGIIINNYEMKNKNSI
jgi:hypothetical protein